MISSYQREGVHLSYPENWTVEDDTDEETRVNVTLSSPNTAFWTLVVYGEALDLSHVIQQAIEALRAEYPDLETGSVVEEIAGQQLVGEDATFFCLDLTNTVRVRAFHRGASTCLIFCQSEDRELETAGPVFDAITQSLLAPSDD